MYKELNSTDGENHDGSHSKSSTVILFLSFSVLSACVLKIIHSKILKNKVPLPFTVAVLLLAFIIGIIITHIDHKTNDFIDGGTLISEIDPHLMYFTFLPLLIFDSAFNGHFHLIKQQLSSAILLAGPGVFISTVIIAICAVYIFPYNWSWLMGAMFGSILSARDPVAVVALLHDAGASRSLASLVECESLLNDGSVFVMFVIFYDIVVAGFHSAKHIIVNIVKYNIAGPAFGLACGIISVLVLNRVNNELEIEITITFGLAYLVFFVAEVELGVSAVLALVVMGLYMSKYKYCISSNVQPSMASAWRIATYFIHILIFTVTGLVLARLFIGTATSISGKDFGYSLVLYIMIHIGRVLSLVILHPFIKCTGIHLSWKDCVILTWSGLRGSMSLILALIVSLDKRIDLVTRDRFLFHVSMIVFLTLIINGTSSKFLVKILGLHHRTKESELVLLQALEHMRKQTSSKLSAMKQDEKFSDVDWKMLNDYVPDKLLEELDEKNNTDFHRRLSTRPPEELPDEDKTTDIPLQSIPSVYKTDLIPSNSNLRTKQNKIEDVILPIIHIRHQNDDEHQKNIRNELITRFLTAMSIDYEKQWYLGMTRRKTLNILIKSVEEAKQKCSLEIHWKVILEHFRLSIFLRLLTKFQNFAWIHRWSDRVLFDHIYQTIELTLSFHSAHSRLDNIRLQFPELSKLNEQMMTEVCEEAKMYKTNAMYVLLDLQQSYRLCWTIQMTRRCAQMLLKYESVAIIQLYETGMLEENEYTHILELIEKKLFILEYGNIQMPKGQRKILENSFDLIPYFQSFSLPDRVRWKLHINRDHRWFQPGDVLLEKDQRVSTAYLIVRGIVQYKDETMPTYYKRGTIVGIDALFSQKLVSRGTYSAPSGLVEVYAIDATVLGLLLADGQISRSIYDEIALHMMMNNYQKTFQLNYSQFKMLLNDKSKFYSNQSDSNIDLETNDRVFLLAGTIIDHSEEQEITIDAIDFVLCNAPKSFRLNSSSIVYTWTEEDESYYLNSKKFKTDFSIENNEDHLMQPHYPNYLGASVEFTPLRHASLMTRRVENTNNLQMIPSEIGVNNELSVSRDPHPHGDGAIRRKRLADSSIEQTYAAALSFLRRIYTRDLTDVDVATTYRPGTRFSLQDIRAASVQVARKRKSYPEGIDILADRAVVDYGGFDLGQPHTIPQAIENHARAIIDQNVLLLSLGQSLFPRR